MLIPWKLFFHIYARTNLNFCGQVLGPVQYSYYQLLFSFHLAYFSHLWNIPSWGPTTTSKLPCLKPSSSSQPAVPLRIQTRNTSDLLCAASSPPHLLATKSYRCDPASSALFKSSSSVVEVHLSQLSSQPPTELLPVGHLGPAITAPQRGLSISTRFKSSSLLLIQELVLKIINKHYVLSNANPVSHVITILLCCHYSPRFVHSQALTLVFLHCPTQWQGYKLCIAFCVLIFQVSEKQRPYLLMVLLDEEVRNIMRVDIYTDDTRNPNVL